MDAFASEPIRNAISILDVLLGFAMMLLVLNGAFFICSASIAQAQIQTDDLTAHIQLRKDNYLTALEDHINGMTQHLQETILEIQNTAQAMSTEEAPDALKAQIEKLIRWRNSLKRNSGCYCVVVVLIANPVIFRSGNGSVIIFIPRFLPSGV